MKKVLVLAVAALMALSLVACGTDSSSSSGEPAGVPFGETARGLFGVMSVRTLRTEKRFFSKKCIRWQHLSPHGNKNPYSKIDKP